MPSDLPPVSVDQGWFAYDTWRRIVDPRELDHSPWSDLLPEVQNAWTATAQAVIDTRPDVRFVARMVDHE